MYPLIPGPQIAKFSWAAEIVVHRFRISGKLSLIFFAP